MEIFLATLAVFGLALLAMSVGLLSGRVRLRGSCGGVAGQCDSAGEPTLEGSSGGGSTPGGTPGGGPTPGGSSASGLACTLCRWTGRRAGAGGER
jgi:hypothetical protein